MELYINPEVCQSGFCINLHPGLLQKYQADLESTQHRQIFLRAGNHLQVVRTIFVAVHQLLPLLGLGLLIQRIPKRSPDFVGTPCYETLGSIVPKPWPVGWNRLSWLLDMPMIYPIKGPYFNPNPKKG